MSRLLVFQHVAAEPLGTLDPLIRARGHGIRFHNFGAQMLAHILGAPVRRHDRREIGRPRITSSTGFWT